MKILVAGHSGVGFGSSITRWFSFAGDLGRTHTSLRFLCTLEEAKSIRDRFGIDWTTDECVESIQGKGVHHAPWGSLYKKSDGIQFFVFNREPTKNENWVILKVAISLLGAKYDWTGIYGFLVRKKTENKNKWFCSELVAYCLFKAGIILWRLPCWKLNPVTCCASPTLKPISLEVQNG